MSVSEFLPSPTPVAADEPSIENPTGAHQVGYRGVRTASDYRKTNHHPASFRRVSQLEPAGRGQEKIIEVIVPVTAELSQRSKNSVESFRFEVYWNRIAFPVADYAPKTQTISDVAGVIAIESSEEKNAGVRLGLNGKYESYLTGNIGADLSNRNSTKKRYEEIPDHDVLVASGTSHRGTGAFFRFHPSKQNTLEGGRELIMAFRVPTNWRAGVLKIECHAEGQRRAFAGWKENFEEGRAFVVPVYVDGDETARQAAIEFVHAEQKLRKRSAERKSANKPRNFFSLAAPSADSLPKDWQHHLIQSGDDDYLEKIRFQLSGELAAAADSFVAARQNILRLGR